MKIRGEDYTSYSTVVAPLTPLLMAFKRATVKLGVWVQGSFTSFILHHLYYYINYIKKPVVLVAILRKV